MYSPSVCLKCDKIATKIVIIHEDSLYPRIALRHLAAHKKGADDARCPLLLTPHFRCQIAAAERKSVFCRLFCLDLFHNSVIEQVFYSCGVFNPPMLCVGGLKLFCPFCFGALYFTTVTYSVFFNVLAVLEVKVIWFFLSPYKNPISSVLMVNEFLPFAYL